MDAAEADLVELQRRAALGLLCAAVAHEVHVPLDCASVALRQAVRRLQGAPVHAGDAVLTRDLDLALESLALARSVLRDAMRLAAPAEGAGTTDLSRDVDAVLVLASAVKPPHVVVSPALAPGLRVLGSTTHVQQIVLNLVTSAFRALEAVDDGEEGLVRVTTCTGPGGGGLLVVDDNGPGIPARLRERLFEPFAAARAAGQGPGLGLHVVKRITDMLGGTLSVDSEPGRGTAVSVELPPAG